MDDQAINKENILETLKGAVSYLDRVLHLKHSITDNIMQENMEKAFKHFEDLIEGFVYLNKLLENVRDLIYLDYISDEQEEKSLESYINHFNMFLEKIVSTMENEDYLLLADLIEYELDQYVQIYKEIFNKIISNVEKEGIKG